MGFLDIGPLELLLILLLTLIIWGPSRIPEIARTLGRALRTLRKTTSELTTTVSKELNLEGKEPLPQSRANSHQQISPPASPSQASASGTEKTSPRDE